MYRHAVTTLCSLRIVGWLLREVTAELCGTLPQDLVSTSVISSNDDNLFSLTLQLLPQLLSN